MALLKGTVYDEIGEPVVNAVVRIEMSYSCGNDRILGYVVTNESGEFLIKVRRCAGLYYKITVFEPLISDIRDCTPYEE